MPKVKKVVLILLVIAFSIYLNNWQVSKLASFIVAGVLIVLVLADWGKGAN